MPTIQGVIHGKTIELSEATAFGDGEVVTVTVERAAQPPPSTQQEEEPPKVDDWLDRLVFDASILPGERIVKGARLSAESLVAEMAKGRRDEEMLRMHPELVAEDLAALRQYARLPQAMRLTFGAWAEDAEELDRFLEARRQRRKLRRREIAP